MAFDESKAALAVTTSSNGDLYITYSFESSSAVTQNNRDIPALYYEISDADGNTYDARHAAYIDCRNEASYNDRFYVYGLPSKPLTVKAWIEQNGIKYCEKSATETPTVSGSFGITAELTQDDTYVNEIGATLDSALSSPKYVYVWYKSKDSKDYAVTQKYVTTYLTNFEISLDYVEYGKEYDFLYVIDGYAVAKSFTPKNDTVVENVTINSEVSSYAHGIDVSLNITDDEAERDNEYKLYVSYYDPATSYISQSATIDADENNSFKALVKGLSPSKEYKVRYVINNGHGNIYLKDETITTAAATPRVEVEAYTAGATWEIYIPSGINYNNYNVVKGSDDNAYLIIYDEAGNVVTSPEFFTLRYNSYYGDLYDDISVSSLKADTSYTYALINSRTYDVMAEGTFKTLKDTRKITLDEIKPLYKGAAVKGTMSDYGSLMMAYRKQGETEWKTSGVYSDEKLFYDTIGLSEYKDGDVIEYRLGYSSTDVDAIPGVLTGTFKIPSDIRVLKEEGKTVVTDGLILKLRVMGPANYHSYIYSYYREKGTDAWNYVNADDIYFDSDEWDNYCSGSGVAKEGLFDYWMRIPSLVDGKTYEYKIGYEGEDSSADKLLKAYTGEFTFKKTDLTIAALNIDTEFYNSTNAKVKIKGEISSPAPVDGTYVKMFYKKKGSEDSDSSRSFWIYGGKTEFDSNITNCLLDTTYEYTIGIADNDSTTKEELKAVKTGEFKTPADTTTITNVEVIPSYESVQVKADVNLAKGLEKANGYYDVYLYYMKKGDTDWTEKYLASKSLGSTRDLLWKISSTLSGFDINSEYDYVIALDYVSDLTKVPDIPDARKKTGTFKTKNTSTEGMKVIFSKNDVATTQYSASMDVEVTGSTDSSVDIKVYYVDTADKDNILSESFEVSKQKNYKNTIVFDNSLKADTTYEITKVELKGYDSYYGYYRSLAPEITPEGEKTFKTLNYPANPTGLKLSSEKIALNSSGATNLDGVNYVRLDATLNGDNVNRKVEFTSSDTSVADVYRRDDDTVIVYAVNPGVAKISANSIGNKSLTGSVEVVVKDYTIGYEDSESNFVNVSSNADEEDNAYKVYKEKVIKDWKLYEKVDGVYKAISGNAIADRKDIVEVKEGTTELTAKNMGTTAVYFTNDTGVKAAAYVDVNAQARKYAVTGLTVNGSSKYAAIETAWEGTPAADSILDKAIPSAYDLALVSGVSYTINGTVSPEDYIEDFTYGNFVFTSSDETVATVNGSGVISPKKAGTATITVKPAETLTALYKDITKSFTITVKELPAVANKSMYVETHTAGKLKDIDLSKIYAVKDWVWESPETTLYSLPVNGMAYDFVTKYTGKVYFPIDDTVEIFLSTINSLKVKDYSLQADKLNDEKKATSVITADGKDTIYLNIVPSYYGNISGLVYDYEIAANPTSGLTITKEGQRYKVTAATAGKYTLTASVKVGDMNVATGVYNIQAVSDKLVGSIELGSEDELVKAQLYEGLIHLDSEEAATKTFTVSANAIGRDGSALTTALEWKTSDKAVVAVTADKTDSHKAKLEVKGNGHAVISVTAKDAAGVHQELNFEVRDHSVRMEDKSATVNTVFDYETTYGLQYADANCQHIEVAGVYADEINFAQSKVTKLDGGDTEFEIARRGKNEYDNLDADLFDCIIKPKKENADVANGTYKYQLSLVTKYRTEPYVYPITIKVINTPIKAKAKSTAMNLFYLPNNGSLEVALNYKGLNVADENPVWEDNSTLTGNEFTFAYYGYGSDKSGKRVVWYSVGQRKVAVSGTKLADAGVDTGKLTIRIPGIRNKDASGVSDKITIENVKIATKYQKANIVALNSTETNSKGNPIGKTVTNLIPELGYDSSTIYFYDKTLKSWLTSNSGYDDQSRYFNGVYSGTPDIKVTNYGYLRYVGNKTSEKTNLTFVSDNWRGTAVAKHSIKAVKAKAALRASNVTINKKYYSYTFDYVYLKPDISNYNFADIVVEGADAKAKGVIADDKMQVYMWPGNNQSVLIQLNNLNVLEQKADVPVGKYSFKVTPYAKKTDGTKVALNTLKLTVNVVDKDLSAKVKTSGTIDLINRYDYYNAVKFTNKFTGSEGLDLVSAKLVGEYDKYFKFYDGDYETNKIVMAATGKLKAKQSYKMKIEYTFKSDDGKMFKVTSNEFTIKPKQSTPKLKLGKISRNFFSATENMNRMTTMTAKGSRTAYYFYNHNEGDVLGTIDANKDGYPDAQVVYVGRNTDWTGPYGNDRQADIDVQILDRDALTSSTKGTKHTIPITVKFVGRDGIAKDSTAKITINVKR